MMVSQPAAPQAAPYAVSEGGVVHSNQDSYSSFNTVNDISYPRDEGYWRPCLDPLPENGGYESRTVHSFQQPEEVLHHGQVPEEDWYKCQHKVW
jgi:hypothetical protein